MKKLQFYRFFYWFLFAFFAVGVPSILISTKYQVFEKASNPKVQLAGGAMMIIVLIAFFMKNQLKEMIESMDEGTLKTIIKQIIRVIPILILYFALRFAEIQMANFKFIVLWSFVSNVIAASFQVIHINYKLRVMALKKAKKG